MEMDFPAKLSNMCQKQVALGDLITTHYSCKDTSKQEDNGGLA
jgi:hypothetical protein